jgi:carbamoyl-phosphate synthase small subunit
VPIDVVPCSGSLIVSHFPPALLALADGTVFRGKGIGATGRSVGEVVFNTAMTGYQEILTDPSYARQIVTLTYPHIGNYGINREDCEAARIHAAGLVIRDLPLLASNFRSEQTLDAYLRAENVLGLAGHRYPQADPHPARERAPRPVV